MIGGFGIQARTPASPSVEKSFWTEVLTRADTPKQLLPTNTVASMMLPGMHVQRQNSFASAAHCLTRQVTEYLMLVLEDK